MSWSPISTAPKDGTIIELRDEKKAHHCAMFWNKRRKLWTGMAFGPMGSTKTYWDESFVKVHEWRPLQLNK